MLNRIEMYESQTSRLAKYLDEGATKKTENGGRVTPCYLCTLGWTFRIYETLSTISFLYSYTTTTRTVVIILVCSITLYHTIISFLFAI